MNIRKLKKLAKKDSPALVYFVRNWMLDRGHKEPVAVLTRIKTRMIWLTICIILSFILLFVAAWIYFHGDPESGAIKIVWLLIASCLLVIPIFLLRKRGYARDTEKEELKLALRFVELLTLLEKEDPRFDWDLVNYERWKILASNILCRQADEVKRLQAIPWRTKSSLIERENFTTNVLSFALLVGVSGDLAYYFQQEETMA